MDLADIEKKKAFIEEFQRKAEQAMRTRIRIARKRTQAIESLKLNPSDEEGNRML